MDHTPLLLELCWPTLRSGARWPKLPRRYLDESYVAEGGSPRGKCTFFLVQLWPFISFNWLFQGD